ncbi:universal stress protein [Agrobacterium tumefaciens]|jgi:nucleotide-binding universal stress UspA family protein|uniref:universal stress protein n=1 Tax=Agrobacterium tumefaciens TaxID=358 RepID=UPI0015729443|nr:universal stress protein [Agrobacterium tumefaciens]
MPFKTLLAIIGANDANADIATAVELATQLDAHLSIMVIGVALQPVVADYPVGAAWLEQRQEEIDALIAVRTHAEGFCKKNGITFDLDEIYDDSFILVSNISMRAMYADIVILGKSVRSERGLRSVAVSAATFDTRTPILLVPPLAKTTLHPANVLLAWNSRAEAANAAKGALDLLKGAELVHVVLVDPDSGYFRNGGEPGADVATYLSRHGVKVVVEQLSSNGRTTEDILTQHALEIGCDMIVMGAYGHSRLRERIFGGVTAAMLKASDFPVFMAR